MSRAHSSLFPAQPGWLGWRAAGVAALAGLCLTAPAAAEQAPPPAQPTPPPGSTAAPVAPLPPAPAPSVAAGTPGSAAGRLTDVIGQSGGLTARDAGRRAAESSVQAAVEHENVASTQNDHTRVIWNNTPRLSLAARYTRLSEVPALDFGGLLGAGGQAFPAAPQNNYALTASLSVPFTEYLLRMLLALRGSNDKTAAAEITERATRGAADAGARLAYYDWVRARLAVVVAQQAVDQARAQLRRVEALHSAGRAAEADLLQARAFQADAELGLSQTDTEQAILEQRLRTAVHAPDEELLSVGENVLEPFAGAEEARPLAELYREAEGQRLELQALARGEKALEQLHTIESTRKLPLLEGFGNFTYANPNQRYFPQQDRWDDSWELGLSLTWSTGDLGNSITAAEAARSQLQQLRHQRTLTLEGLRLEVASAYRALAQARLNVTTAEQGERAAVAALEARARLEEQGLATALELMQAQTAQVQARLNLINAHIAVRVARVQLDHALGRDVRRVGSPRS